MTKQPPPTTARALRARIKARGLNWSVKLYPPHKNQYKRHYTLWLMSEHGVTIFKCMTRLRCIELAWRMMKTEPTP